MILTPTTLLISQYKQESKTGFEAGFKALEALKRFKVHVNFLLQSLEIWMFLPAKLVDNIWVVLEKPKSDGQNIQKFKSDSFDYKAYWEKQNKEYEIAKSNVLFKGFEIEEETENIIWLSIKNFNSDRGDFTIQYSKKINSFSYSFIKYKIIEDLIKYNLELSLTAEKILSV